MDKILTYYQTTDYDKFRFLETNRTVGSSKNLKKSIETIDLTPYVPILVTPDFYIIDGQNRFEICRLKRMPIYYIICDKDEEVAMIALNTASKPWRNEEWVQYYAKKGYIQYIKLLQMMGDLKLNISNAILLFSQGATNSEMLKKGKLIDKSELVEPIVKFVDETVLPNDIKKQRSFTNGLMIFFQRYYKSDNKRIKKLSKKIHAIIKFARTEDYVNMFENLSR